MLAATLMVGGWGSTSTSSAQLTDPLDSLAERALELPDSTPRFIKNFKQGLRAATYSSVMVSPSDPEVIYVASMDGYV
ncbi:MAG: hypothetical protein QF464_14390, partial [Myxococcota bacterium]|nr:hypothetical protein [Myxococcota bacterium]